MAEYNKTKFYWLQLKEDFFEDDAIQWLEEQKPNGRDYAYFYLKLCLKALKSNGLLIRKVGTMLMPYDNKKLAELTKMDFDTVTVAMELLKKIGLVTVLETGEIYINQLENLIGSKSVGAFKKQQQRMLSGQKGDICPPKIEIELEIDNRDILLHNISCPNGQSKNGSNEPNLDHLDQKNGSNLDQNSPNCQTNGENELNGIPKVDQPKPKCELDFELFWLRYPKKEKKKDALKWFKSKKYKESMFDEIMNGLENQLENKKSCLNREKQYIPLATTWLNGEQWKDEYDIENEENPFDKVIRELEEEQK